MPDVSTVLNAKAAIARHIQWKIALQLAITLQEPLTSDQMHQIQHSRECAVGRWLDSPLTFGMRSSIQFSNLQRLHIEFHQQMLRVAEMISDQRFEEAARAISPSSPFMQSSKALAHAVMAYDALTTIAVPV